jgi:hypothetical protein
MSDTDLWANFLCNEKLSPQRCAGYEMSLVQLCEELAKKRGPKVRPYKLRLESRQLVVQTAMDLGIDLAGIKFRGKMAMARSLLDTWNSEYTKRFGSNIGTSSWKEDKRRNAKMRLKHEQDGQVAQEQNDAIQDEATRGTVIGTAEKPCAEGN